MQALSESYDRRPPKDHYSRELYQSNRQRRAAGTSELSSLDAEHSSSGVRGAVSEGPAPNRENHQSWANGQQTRDRIRAVSIPQLPRVKYTPSSRSGADSQSTVFLGEASSLTWTSPTVSHLEANSSSGEKSVRLSFPAPSEQSHESSASFLAQSARRSKRIDYLRSIGAFSVPDYEVWEEVLTAYFKWFHPCFPILDRPSFHHDFVSKTVSPLLLQAMLFVGVTYCEVSLLHRLGFADLQDARSTYYNNAKDIYDADYEEDRIVIIQALFLMSYWREGPQLEKDTRHWLSAAISLAQKLGIHRARSTNPDQAKRRLRKRIWWTLYVRDRQSSTAVGMPWFIQDRDCDIEELAVVDFEEDTMRECPRYLAPQATEYMQYLIQMAGLVKIMGEIVTTEFRRLNGHTSSSERSKLKDRLVQWEHELPQEMTSLPSIGSTSNFFATILHTYHYNAYILLYRSEYVQNGKLLEGSGGQIALQAACRITSIAEELLSQNMICHVNTHMITCFFNSLCIHTISMRRSNDIGRQIAEKRAQVCLLGLKELKKTWDVDNWVLKLFFQHIDNPTKKRLQLEDSADTVTHPSHDVESSGSQQNRGESLATSSMQSTLPNEHYASPQPDLSGFDWTSISHFFNSKEAENFSLYQLEPNFLGDERDDFTFDPTINVSLPESNDSFL